MHEANLLGFSALSHPLYLKVNTNDATLSSDASSNVAEFKICSS